MPNFESLSGPFPVFSWNSLCLIKLNWNSLSLLNSNQWPIHVPNQAAFVVKPRSYRKTEYLTLIGYIVVTDSVPLCQWKSSYKWFSLFFNRMACWVFCLYFQSNFKMSPNLPFTGLSFLQLSLILATCQCSVDMTSTLRPCLQDVGTWRYSPLSVSLWWMRTEVRQWVGQVSPCGAASYRSSRASGVELSINMQIKSDPSAGGTLSLAEEPKVKLAYIRMMVAIPEDILFLVICHQLEVRGSRGTVW